MSQWINKDLFSKFTEEKKNEKDNTTNTFRADMVWKNPERGTAERAKVYEGRFLPDPKGNFYKKFHYHMFQVGDKWQFFLCPKSFNFDEYCDLCAVTSKLYMGDSSDKKVAYQYKRKDKFICNWYIVDDPRDAENDDKVAGSVRLYEFPGKVEQKLREQITDSKNGLGPAIFDPGPEGFNFIIKVGATKKDARGNVWPDYSLSDFSRRAAALGTDDEIKKIMSSTYDIDKYLQEREADEENIINILKQLSLFDLVKNERKRAIAFKDQMANDDIPKFDKKAEEKVVEEKEEVPFDTGGEEKLSDDDLLAQLDQL